MKPCFSENLEVSVFRSNFDGKLTVEIYTGDIAEADQSENGIPILRINLNEATLWEGFNDGSESYGRE